MVVGCVVEQDDQGPEYRALADNEGIVVDSRIGSIYLAGDICVLYASTDLGTVGLVVSQDEDDPPLCGALDPYLGRIDVIVGWDAGDIEAISNTNLLQNLSEEFDRASGRSVDYYWLDGPLEGSLWGTIYGDLERETLANVGPVCGWYMETDEGTPIGLFELEDALGACPRLEAVSSNSTVRVPLDALLELTNLALTSALSAAFWNVDQHLAPQVALTEL